MGCGPRVAEVAQSPGTGTAQGANGLASLSDEFANAGSLANWKQIHKTEGWNADQLAECSIASDVLTLTPHSSSWYQDYRGVLLYKEVSGDFVVTTKVRTTGRDGRSAPNVLFSLGGIMVRTPRSDNARTWQPGRENYVFLSLGCADRPGTYQFEVKTTERSVSTLEKIPAGGGEALLRVVRSGSNLILLRNQGGQWTVHKRYSRPDMPAQLQVGLTVYTDWDTVSKLSPIDHNSRVLRNGSPDLIAKFDYVRYSRPPVVPGAGIGNLSDGELIRALGAVQ